MNKLIAQREENLKLSNAEYESGLEFLSSTPPVVFVELTQDCNLRCRMCRSSARVGDIRTMSRELFDELLEIVLPKASLVDLRGWGESTILPDFDYYVKAVSDLGSSIRLVTNALAINEITWDLLMRVNANVTVSVDACTSETMARLGRGSFSKLVSSLNNAMRAQARHGKGQLRFNTVLSAINLTELHGIIMMAKDFGVNRITAFPIVAKRKSALHLDNVIDSLPTIIRESFFASAEAGVSLRLGASLHETIVSDVSLPLRCSHPWQFCYIDYSGNVGYCDHLIGNKSLTLGTLGPNKFMDVWNNEAFRDLRRNHAERGLINTNTIAARYPHCEWCYHRRYIDFEDDFIINWSRRVFDEKSATFPLSLKSGNSCYRGDFF